MRVIITYILIIITCKQSIICQILQAYREGFLNEQYNIPGSHGDVRELPSLPFSTNTNRYSDGITTSSIYSVTSPHFPIYNNSNKNITNRAKYHLDYIKSAATQGIGIYGDGDAVVEDSRYKIVKNREEENIPKPNKTFTVRAAVKWNPSGFAIQVNEEYKIEVLGSHYGYGRQFWNDGGIRVDADGYESFYDAISNCHVALGRCRSHLRSRKRLLNSNWMSLVCAIGQFVKPLTPIIPGKELQARYLPLDEAILQDTIFHVGTSFQFTANSTGELICFANDAHTLYWNNHGSLEVTVTRMNWPPVNETYYQQKYRPSCDSADVVYGRGSIPCNPSGGGAGWSEEQIHNSGTRYGLNV